MDRLAHVDSDVTPPCPRVAVVGGGYAGMAAAVDLAAAGFHTCVFESGRVLGGRARRVEYRGQILDNGQHILSGAYSALLERMHKVGVVAAEAFARTPLNLSMPPHFSLRAMGLPAPLHTLGGLLSARGLSWADRFSAIRFMLALRRCNYRVDPDTTVTQLLDQERQSPRLNRYLWVPLTLSALNTPPSNASAQVFANVLRDALAGSREDSDLLLPRQDLSRLFPEAAAEWVKARNGCIRLGETTRRVDTLGQKIKLETTAGTEAFDGVILAIGPHQFDAIALPEGVQRPAFSYEPITTVYFHFNVPVHLPEPMLGQAAGCAQWFFDRSGLAGSAGGESTIAAVISATGEHSTMDQEQLVATLLRELTIHVTDLPNPAWCKVINEKFATFACTTAAQRSRPSTQTSIPNIWLAGDYLAGDYPATLEGAVRSGAAAAAAARHYFHPEHRQTP